MSDMLEIANEVQDTLGRTYGMPDDIDEADLEAGRIYFHALVCFYVMKRHHTVAHVLR